MRARNIKPGFFINEKLADVAPIARILFVGLWCYADREGLFEWRPRKIKAAILPYENCDIDRLLMSLQVNKFIYKYSHEGKEYGAVKHFSEHQNPHPHEAKSKLPKPQENQCDDMSVTCNEMSPKCNADSLIPDSLIPDSNTYCASVDARREDFLKFWDLFDYKKGKDPAWRAWKKITHYKQELVEKIFSAAREEAKRRPALEANGRTPKMAQGWISDKRWEDEAGDEFSTTKVPTQRKNAMQTDMDDLDALLGGGNGKQGMGQTDGSVNAQSTKVIELTRNTGGHYG